MNSTATTPIAVGLGEILWDCFPDQRRPGGAPANFAFHANQLGLRGVVCSRVGNDELGDEFLEHLRQHSLGIEHVSRDEQHATGRVDIHLDEDRQPHYTFVEDVAWDYLPFDPATESLVNAAAAICFGTLAQRSELSRETIQQCLDQAGDRCLKVYDINIRAPWYEPAWINRSLEAADIVKLNEDEVRLLVELLQLGMADPQFLAGTLQERFGVQLLCITRGERGCQLISGVELAEAPGEPVEVADPVGAGDSFTAAMIYARLHDWPLEHTARFANAVAGLVASRPGAMPSVRDEMKALREKWAP
jgi:fructokinase